MKFLIDFFPVLLFFITYQVTKSVYGQGDFFLATGVLLVASIIQFIILKKIGEKIGKMHKINLALIIVLGLATLLLKDVKLLQWKVSIVNWAFGLVFIGSQFIGSKPIIERMMSSALQVPKNIWARLNFAWGSFFISLGFLNWYVKDNYSIDDWVNFKFYGLIGLTIVFIILQAIYVGRHITEPDPKKEAATNTESNSKDS